MKTIAKGKLPQFFEELSLHYRVLVPAKEEGKTRLVQYKAGLELVLDKNMDLPPKDIFFPQTEKMYKFKTKKESLEIETIEEDKGEQVLFGLRSCDLKSLDCLDQVFLTKGYVDSFYQNKREKSILISLACNEPEPSCFCTSMGLDPQKSPEADLEAYDLGEKIAFEIITEKGRQILEATAHLLLVEEVAIPAIGDFPLTLSVDGVAEKLKNMFDHPLWEEISRSCLNCGICTYICPTCHCFDIASQVRGEDGIKIRCWDSCMFGEYTQMAGGHQPRPGKKERLRNRFLHKLRYFPERYQMYLCTGCGRCLMNCPVNIDITQIIKKIQDQPLLK